MASQNQLNPNAYFANFRANLFSSPVLGGSPQSISGLKMWLKSDVGVTTSNISSAKFVRANSEYLSVANSATVQTGDIDFTLYARVKYGLRDQNQDLISRLGNSGSWEYLVRDEATALKFYVSSNGTSLTGVGSTATINTGTWYDLFAWHDSVNNTINVQIGSNTPASTAYSAGLLAANTPLELGRSIASGNYFQGNIDTFAFWKRVLTANERTFIINSGSGTPYESIGVAATNGSALKTSLITWHDFGEASGTRSDKHGTTNLTDNNTVVGVPDGVASTGDNLAVTTWADQSGNSNDVTQNVDGGYPIKVTNAINSLPGLQFDGISQYLSKGTMLGLSNGAPRTFIVVGKIPNATARAAFVCQGTSGSSSDYLAIEANTSGTTGSKYGLFATQNTFDSNAATDTNWHTFYVAFTTTTAAQGIAANTDYRVDGTTKTLTIAANNGGNFTTLTAANITQIGKLSTNFATMTVAEVLIYDSALTATQRSGIYSYLHSRYGL